MHSDLDRTIIPADEIAKRVAALGERIADRHRGVGEPLIVVTVLNGGLVFLADLIRSMPISIRLGVIGVSSYGGDTTKSKGAKITMRLDVEGDLRGRHVLIVDDILDTGNTLGLVQRTVASRHPRAMETAVLLRKPGKAPEHVAADYVGFDIEDEFVVGYGLDYGGRYRNLPYIGVLRQELYAAGAVDSANAR